MIIRDSPDKNELNNLHVISVGRCGTWLIYGTVSRVARGENAAKGLFALGGVNYALVSS